MKLFKTGNIDLVKCYQSCFCFELPIVYSMTGVLENWIKDTGIIRIYFVR